MDKDELAALDRAATQAKTAFESAFIGGARQMSPQENDLLAASIEANAAFTSALVNAYRTGKLVLIDDGGGA
jgi:CHASE3 domain sensor protein